MNARQQSAWWLFGGGREAMNLLYKDYGVVSFLSEIPTARWAAGSGRRSRSVADLKGLKFRIGGFAGVTLARLGAVPQQLAAPDIYRRWRRAPSTRRSGSAPTTTRSSASTRWRSSTTTRDSGRRPDAALLRQREEWAELPKSYQAAFETACGDATTWMMAKYDAQNPPALRRLVASGTQLRAFSRSILEAAEKASYEIYDEMSAKSPHFKRIYTEWKKFRDEQFLWFRVAEQSYDNYAFNSKIGQPAPAKADKKS